MRRIFSIETDVATARAEVKNKFDQMSRRFGFRCSRNFNAGKNRKAGYTMTHNFHKITPRTNTNSLKYDYAKELNKPSSAIPLWVADMDFQTPPEVTEALTQCAQHGIFGYTITKEDYASTVQNWFANNFGFQSKPEWIVKTPGVVYALAMAVRAFTQKGDAVMIQKPVYYPFEKVIEDNHRKVVDNSLIYENGRYHIDFDDFERKIINNNVRMFILCSPHNPVGRVWTADELYQMGQICLRHNCLIISDEIHCDLTFEGHTHRMFPTVHPSFLDNTVICTAPSKTFNLAGLQNSNIFIPNEGLRKQFITEITKSGYGQLNTMGLAACKAAYEHGHDWLVQLRSYLQDNLEFMKAFFAEHIPQVKVVEPEGTYLIWLDFNALGLSHEDLDDMLLNQAKVWLSSGTLFGPQGEGFQRINIGCPRQTLEAALKSISTIM